MTGTNIAAADKQLVKVSQQHSSLLTDSDSSVLKLFSYGMIHSNTNLVTEIFKFVKVLK